MTKLNITLIAASMRCRCVTRIEDHRPAISELAEERRAGSFRNVLCDEALIVAGHRTRSLAWQQVADVLVRIRGIQRELACPCDIGDINGRGVRTGRWVLDSLNASSRHRESKHSDGEELHASSREHDACRDGSRAEPVRLAGW